MTFLICLALGLNFTTLYFNLAERRYGWATLSVAAIVMCVLGLTACTTMVQDNSPKANRTVEMRKR